MNKTFKPVALLLLSGIGFMPLLAQDDKDKEKDKSKDESIIIHKKGTSKDKVTVVIDGDNITVNGKPVDDFKSDDIDIIKEDSPEWGDMAFNGYGDGGSSWVAPAMPQIHAFRNDMSRIKSNSAFLGVMTETTEQGAKITEVTDKSAAERAGLKEGDIITKIGDDKISSPDDLYKAIGKHKPEEKVTIAYLRDGKQATAQATLDKSNQMKIYSWNTPQGDFDMKNFGPYNFAFAWGDKPRLGIEAQDTEDGVGVKITDVDDDDEDGVPAAKAGLKENDIITQVNGKAVNSVDDLRDSMKDVKKGDTVKITYKRNNQTQTVDVKFPKELKTIDL